MNNDIFHKVIDVPPFWHRCKNSDEIILIVNDGQELCAGIETEIYRAWESANETVYQEFKQNEDFDSLYDSLRASCHDEFQFGAAMALIVYEDSDELLYQTPEFLLTMGLIGNTAAMLLYPVCVSMN